MRRPPGLFVGYPVGYKKPPRHSQYEPGRSGNPSGKPKGNGDYSVCTMWGYLEGNFYLLDLWRKQVNFPQLRRAIVDLNQKWQPTLIIVKSVGSGMSLCQDLEQTLGGYVVPWGPEGTKHIASRP